MKTTAAGNGQPGINFREIMRYVESGASVELEGSEKLSGRDAYVLVLTPGGAQDIRQRLFVDKEYWLPLKVVTDQGGSGYRVVAEYTSIELNTGISDSAFEFKG